MVVVVVDEEAEPCKLVLGTLVTCLIWCLVASNYHQSFAMQLHVVYLQLAGQSRLIFIDRIAHVRQVSQAMDEGAI
jgi:hypothetical protein